MELLQKIRKPSWHLSRISEFQRRYLNEKWYGRYGANGAFLEYNESDEWKEVDEDMREFVEQLWYEQQNAEQQVGEISLLYFVLHFFGVQSVRILAIWKS